MSRLSFRPRPLDIHKKLPIVKSVKDFEDDDTPTASATRGCQLLRLSAADSDFNVSNNTEVPLFFMSLCCAKLGFMFQSGAMAI